MTWLQRSWVWLVGIVFAAGGLALAVQQSARIDAEQNFRLRCVEQKVAVLERLEDDVREIGKDVKELLRGAAGNRGEKP